VFFPRGYHCRDFNEVDKDLMGVFFDLGLFLIWWISMYGAQEEGVCWNCFSPLRRGALMEVTPQQQWWQ